MTIMDKQMNVKTTKSLTRGQAEDWYKDAILRKAPNAAGMSDEELEDTLARVVGNPLQNYRITYRIADLNTNPDEYISS